MHEKFCTACKETLPILKFWKNRSKKDGLYDTCKECCIPYFKEHHRQNRIKQVIADYKLVWAKDAISRIRRRARSEAVPFDLTVEQLLGLMTEHCPVFHKTLDYQSVKTHDWVASIDRLDGSLGYIFKNVVVISYMANRMKSNASLNEIKKVAAWVVANGVIQHAAA